MNFSGREQMPKLEVYGWLLETSWGVVPEDRLEVVFDALSNEQFDVDDFEDILGNNNETGINTDLDIEIIVDGELQNFDKDLFSEEVENPVLIEDDENEGQFFLIEETASKGLIYSCEISEEFDQEKLSLWYYNYALGDTGSTIDVLEIEYDGQDCLDRNTDVKVYEVKLMRPDGTICEFEESNDNVETTEVEKERFQKIYVFKDRITYKKFLEEYLDPILSDKDVIFTNVITSSGEGADELWVALEDTSDELLLTPDEGDWLADEIGEFSVRWSPRDPFED
jgi:hypothetical protein